MFTKRAPKIALHRVQISLIRTRDAWQVHFLYSGYTRVTSRVNKEVCMVQCFYDTRRFEPVHQGYTPCVTLIMMITKFCRDVGLADVDLGHTQESSWVVTLCTGTIDSLYLLTLEFRKYEQFGHVYFLSIATPEPGWTGPGWLGLA